jgi:hypothetical protein
MNPRASLTDAVTLPLAIKSEIKASSDKAVLGILNKPCPEPEKKLPDDKNILPLKVEPLATDVTINPLTSLTDAVTLPLAIKSETNASSDKAVLGILNNPSPLPLKKLPLFNSIPPLIKSEPLKVEPLSIEVTTNPLSSLTEAVTLPLAISDVICASSDKAVLGMLNKPSPLPLKNPLPDGILTIPSTVNDPVISTEPVNC